MITKEITISGNKLRLIANFQPVIHLSRKNIFRYEALTTFYNEEGSQLSTQEVIEIAEGSGAIYEVTDYIFDYICQLLKKKAQLNFAFNLSPLLLNDLSYIKKLYQKCVEQGIETQRIDIKISERVTHRQLVAGRHCLAYAKSCGFTVSLDDFGAGNLSRDSLDVFRFDTIKIDRSMIADIGSDAGRWSHLQSMMAMLQPLGVNIVCEGVEKKTDLEQLKRYRGIAIQGYIFYRPLTFSQLKLLEDF
ncbi:EAL domain-containing protein [Kosakonia sp. H02]|nr:EAL domain-containing protein [Kosakonia sp. H02]